MFLEKLILQLMPIFIIIYIFERQRKGVKKVFRYSKTVSVPIPHDLQYMKHKSLFSKLMEMKKDIKKESDKDTNNIQYFFYKN